MSASDKEKWQQRYHEADANGPSPALVLSRYAHLLPSSGQALDLAAGLGANARMFARHGLETQAWDLSATAMEKLAEVAKAEGLNIHCEVRDVVVQPPQSESFDVLIVSRFLERSLCPAIAAALKPGGLLFYQTFVQDRVDNGFGPRNPDYLLTENELLQLFPGLLIRAYHEEGTVGDTSQGTRNEALLVAQRPEV